MNDERCEAVHGPTGEQCLRGLHDGRHVGRGPVEWIGSGDTAASRGKKSRESKEQPVWVEFRYGPGGVALGYFWGPAREKDGLHGKPAHFGIPHTEGGK